MPERISKLVEVYEIKVTLCDSQPPIWRRIQVRSDVTLAKLHRILQCVMGWEDAHLHEFVIQGEYYGIPDQDEGEQRKIRDERKYKLGDIVAAERSQFAYNYDFGDYWQHVLVIEKTLPPKEGVRYPVCLAGSRACPPEDVGGISGYENFLQAIKNPDHPEHGEYRAWVGSDFDPEALAVDEVNQRLRRHAVKVLFRPFFTQTQACSRSLQSRQRRVPALARLSFWLFFCGLVLRPRLCVFASVAEDPVSYLA